MAGRIEDYALIGDCRAAALVGRDGSIDWLCWPRFDSPACLAALLGTDENGRWRVAPIDHNVSVARRYRGNTLILETEFRSASGAVRLIDFMVVGRESSHLVRRVVGLEGRVGMRFDLSLRFDYGGLKPWVQVRDEGLVAIAGTEALVLRTEIPVDGDPDAMVAEFAVSEGETVSFVLSQGPSVSAPPPPIEIEQALNETEAFWEEWAGRFDQSRAHTPAAVVRSLVTLKALIYRPSGGIVAAATTSLPEALGGSLNWDYRYCWLRDATFTLIALLNAGYQEEAVSWRDWMLRSVAGDPARVRIMYRLDGGRHLGEWTVPWLSGYQGAAPVRIGNAASSQLQVDVFGELLDALFNAANAGMEQTPHGRHVVEELVRHLTQIWHEPGQGLWEARGDPKHYTYSQVMAWAGIDRFIRHDEARGSPDTEMLQHLRSLRTRIHDHVCAKGFDPAQGSFVQHEGSKVLDGSLLLLPLVGFLPVSDPRMAGTIAAIERELVDDRLVRRYPPPPGGEGVFIACSFWLVDCLVLQKRLDEARALFDRLLGLRNDLGLLSEEYDCTQRRLVGNFPQAFSHVALVNSALNLAGTTRPDQRHGI